jgi:hypothetical protein
MNFSSALDARLIPASRLIDAEPEQAAAFGEASPALIPPNEKAPEVASLEVCRWIDVR